MPSFWAHLTTKDLEYFKRAWFERPELLRGKILDIPTGNGRDAVALHELGYQVVPADLFPERFTHDLDGVQSTFADMARPLPFEGDSFDYVLSSEGIEHLADQFAFLGECARVLRPGGKLVLTTPNLLSLRARMAFMLTGNRAFRSFVDEVTSVWGYDSDRLYHGHAFLINYLQLRYMLWHNDLRVLGVQGTRYGTTSLLLTPLVPAIWWFTQKAMRKARKKNPDPTTYREINRDLFSRHMLLSSNLFVIAEKMKPGERKLPKTLVPG